MTRPYSYPEGITSEILMAYADGALPDADRARVEAALAEVPELGAEIAAYRQSLAMLDGAFDAPLREPVPAHLEALVMGHAAAPGPAVVSLDAARARRASRGFPAWAQGLAACLVFGMGALLGSGATGGDPATPDTLLMAGRLAPSHPIARALETAVSAEPVSLDGGSFVAYATFVAGSGAPCREYEAFGESDAVTGLACRAGSGWQVEFLQRGNPASSPDGGYQLASSADPALLDAALLALRAGPGLAADAEACLIANGWRVSACQ